MTPSDLRILASEMRSLGRWLCREHENEVGGALLRLASHIKRRAREIEHAGPSAFVVQMPTGLENRHIERTLRVHEFFLHHIDYQPQTKLTTALISPL